MSSTLDSLLAPLAARPAQWLITGVAGFIGSHLAEGLLKQGQRVVGLDDFSTGRMETLREVRAEVGEAAWSRFRLVEGSVLDPDLCARAMEGVDYVLHHAALVSVPRSLEEPVLTTWINVGGFANLLASARHAGVRRVVYASSSAVYGDASGAANREECLGEPLSPYALTKRENELQAKLYAL